MGPKYCSKCGAMNNEESQFCVKCGAPLTLNDVNSTMNQRPNFKSDKSSNNNSILFLVIGWLSVAISLFFIPLVFGGIGVALGFAERRFDNTQGTILIVASIICGVLGVVIGAIVGATTFDF